MVITEGLLVEEVVGKGRGVVAGKNYGPGDTVEVCPVLFTFDGFVALGDEGLSQYELYWTEDTVAMAGGLAHFYNHSNTPNIVLERNLDTKTIVVRALKFIVDGEELCHDYECDIWW